MSTQYTPENIFRNSLWVCTKCSISDILVESVYKPKPPRFGLINTGVCIYILRFDLSLTFGFPVQ